MSGWVSFGEIELPTDAQVDTIIDARKGTPEGLASLDAAGRVPETELPARLAEAALSATIDAAVEEKLPDLVVNDDSIAELVDGDTATRSAVDRRVVTGVAADETVTAAARQAIASATVEDGFLAYEAIAEDGIWFAPSGVPTERFRLVDGDNNIDPDRLPETHLEYVESADSPWAWGIGYIDPQGVKRVALGRYKNGSYYPATLNPATSANRLPVVLIGDSQTAGWGAVAQELSTALGRPVIQTGVGGQRPDQIAARDGGAPPLITLEGGLIPASGPVTATAVQQPYSDDGTNTATGFAAYSPWFSNQSKVGLLAGIPGTLSATATGYVFTRSTAGVPVTVPARTPFQNGFDQIPYPVIVCIGRNGFKEMSAEEIDWFATAILNRHTDRRQILMSIMPWVGEATGTGVRSRLEAANALLQSRHADLWWDSAAYLRSEAALRAAGIEPTATDLQNIADGLTPQSFRTTLEDGSPDAGHYNAAAYRRFIPMIKNIFDAKGWNY